MEQNMSGDSSNQRDDNDLYPGAGRADRDQPSGHPDGQSEPSQQEQHNPETDEDTASGGSPESPGAPG